MKKVFCLLLIFALPLPVLADESVNGSLFNIDELQVLHVWGTSYEMGYAQGYFLGDQIKTIFDEYVMPYMGFPQLYSLVRLGFGLFYQVPDNYMDEAQGVIDGAKAAGFDLHVAALGRELDADDLNTAGAMADFDSLVACSSLLAWGTATSTDPELAGAPAIVRNLDWLGLDSDPTFLARTTLVVAREPEGRRATVSIAFPGFLGCLSCMNDAGVTAVQQQSRPNVDLLDFNLSEKFVPIHLTMREGLELDDPTGDGVSTVDDEAEIVIQWPRSSAYNIAVIGPDPMSYPPFILETNNGGHALRYDVDSPEMGPEILAVTNHMRKLAGPYGCERYSIIEANVAAWGGEITLDRMWQNNGDVSVNGNYITAQTMIFIPEQMRFALAYSDQSALAPEKAPIWFDWDDLFPLIPDDDDDDDNDTADDDDDTSDDDDDDDDNDNDISDDDDDSQAVDDDETGDESDNNSDSSGCGC